MSNEDGRSALEKVQEIFQSAFGERAARSLSSHNVSHTMHTVIQAFGKELDATRAEELGFHMADWAGDAAFVLAIHVFPERFTPEEIRAGTLSLAAHLPYHVKAIAKVLGFSEDEEPGDEHESEA